MPASRLPLLVPLLIFLLGSLAGLFASYDRALSLPFVGGLWMSALLYLALVWWCTTPGRLRTAAAAVVLVAAAGALLLFIQYRHLGFERKSGVITLAGELTSAPFPHLLRIPFQQNMAAAFLEGALPLALGLWASGQGRWRHSWLACALLIGAGVALTVSRAALLALAACAAVAGIAWLATRRPRVARAAIIGAAGTALALGALLVLTPLPDAGPVQSLLARAADRAALYRNTLFLILDMPFTGIGGGETFAMVYSRYALLIEVPYLTYAHSLPLAIWLSQGLLGILGFGAMLVALTRLHWRAGRAGAGPLWLGAALGSLALLLHGLGDAPQYNTGWWAMLMAWAIMGVAAASGQLAAEGQPAASPRPAAVRRVPPDVAGGALLITAFAAALLGGRQMLALMALNTGAAIEARADLGPGLADAQRAQLRADAAGWYWQVLHLDPEQPGALRRLGVQATAGLRFAEAAASLEAALHKAPANQTTWKALGYAYLWSGCVDQAVTFFSRLDRAAEVAGELDTWTWWWGQQGRPDLAELAASAAIQMAQQQEAGLAQAHPVLATGRCSSSTQQALAPPPWP